MQNKYVDIIKKNVVDYIENKIHLTDLIESFRSLNNEGAYESLEQNGYKGLSNFVSAIQELNYQNNQDAEWIIKTIDDFYALFINDFSYIYGRSFYKYLRFGLEKEISNPVEVSFDSAVKDYLNNKISNDCLGFIASEFLNNLKYFQEEINLNQELKDNLNTTLKLKFNRILEDLTPEESKLKQEIDKKLNLFLKK